jgi:hypothetical protein
MASAERQSQISAAVTDAVESFCVAQSSRPAPQVAHARPRHTRKRTVDTAPVTTWAQHNVTLP